MFDIEHRRPIWMALSEFYLDTELQESDFRNIAFTILDSPYTLEEVRFINKYEVFPLLQTNLLSVAGEWAGFDEGLLIDAITSGVKHKKMLNAIGVSINYQIFKWMLKVYWGKVERAYNEIKSEPDSFIVTCRTAFNNNILPFQFERSEEPIYKKLEQIAINYRNTNRLQEFYQYLQEDHYFINIWTAYFLLEKFEVNQESILVGLNDKETIFNFCYRLIENTLQTFKGENQIKNCSYWLEENRPGGGFANK